ncbi:unnamed protein product [Ilex paraguariensis]|uniref:Bifunctional inhibitor/plant lipid transfer protein/seed storage helical domain-containing protein n=1 Tax=Ilex paraguariensis TaxID=185542 RepID=A0ABC8UU28_9AQUA
MDNMSIPVPYINGLWLYKTRTKLIRKMRGTLRARSWVGMLVLVLMVGDVCVFPMVSGATTPNQCKEEKRLLVNACRGVIFGQNPSAACCQRVRVTQVECVCPSVTSKLAALIGVQRAIKQIQGCGRAIPRNFKCGSKH